jgi:endo-1,4-beta-xylanase
LPDLLTVALLLLVGCIRPAPVPEAASTQQGAPISRIRADLPPLREGAARAHRRIGTALMTHHLQDPTFRKLAALHFDSLTPENEMKWGALEPMPGKFTFGAGDALVAFAIENNMRVRGHTLVWHQQLGGWVKSLSGEALRAAMLAHTSATVGHWKGKIAQWDVVNEALADDGKLRADSPFTALGPTYIDQAFRAAHEADPQALLFYNDYEIEGMGSPKAEAAIGLVKRLKDAGVPIHGVGLQMHVDPRRWPSAAAIRQNIERIAALGLQVEITEMDVPVGEVVGTTVVKLERQRVLTHDILAACLAVPGCTGITFWGFTDRHTWLNDPQWGRLRGRMPHLPLPFDADYQPKPMFTAIADAFAGR